MPRAVGRVVSGVDKALARIRGKLGDRVELRGMRGHDIAVELHETAPRGGTNLNAYGQNRSAPGEPPAVEHGDLREALLNGYSFDESSLTARFVANHVLLEYGTVRMDPRPMGRLTIEQLKQEVGGS